jgi:hypothetical protein
MHHSDVPKFGCARHRYLVVTLRSSGPTRELSTYFVLARRLHKSFLSRITSAAAKTREKPPPPDDPMEPVALDHLLTAFVAGAAVILSGAAYALLFAWSRLRHRPGLMGPAYVAYACLAAAVLTLANVFHMSGLWAPVVVAMLVGYLVAPRIIWRLTVAIDATDEARPGSDSQHV